MSVEHIGFLLFSAVSCGVAMGMGYPAAAGIFGVMAGLSAGRIHLDDDVAEGEEEIDESLDRMEAAELK